MDLNPTQLKFAPIEIIWQESNGRFCIVAFFKRRKNISKMQLYFGNLIAGFKIKQVKSLELRPFIC
ncbi:hypothetical protein IH824_10350 [candidate division KSB1 bacterium]|nr:hypothetical protein [candidate division KSB1 bacterium]